MLLTLTPLLPGDVIALRNAHEARELAQRAISSRNARLPLSRLQGSPLLLTEPDLGLDSAHGLASLAEQRRAVRAVRTRGAHSG